MSEFEPIRYVDQDSGETRVEAVYGGFWVRALYGTRVGRLLSSLVSVPPVSRFCGWLQDRPSSQRKIDPAILENTSKGLENYVRAGQALGREA